VPVPDPSSIALLAAWHRASDVSGVADGGVVASVPDASGNSRPATQATTANKPTWIAARAWANGKPSIRLNQAAPQYLATAFPAVSAGQPFTVFLFFYVWPASPSASNIVLTASTFYMCDRTKLALTNTAFTNSYSSSGIGDPKGDNPVPLSMVFACDGVNSKVYINGVDVTASGTNGFSPALAVGSLYNNSAAGNAAIVELLEGGMYTGYLSPTDATTLENYKRATYYPATGVQAVFATPSGATGVANATLTLAPYPSYTLAGVGTMYGWLAAGSTVVTATDGASGTLAPTTSTLTNAAPAATPTYTPASAGSKTLSPANDAGLTPVGAYYGSTTAGTTALAYNHAGILFSPYNHRDSGTYDESNNSGSYIRTRFGGTSIKETFDFSAYAAASSVAADYPTILYRVDGTTNGTYGWTRYLLTSADTTFTYATGLSAGTLHTLERVFLCPNQASLAAGTIDRWVTPLAALRSTGFVVDSGFTFSQPPRAPDNAVFYCDSLGEGWSDLSLSTSSSALMDSAICWPTMVARGLNCEWGQVCFGGWDFGNTASGGVPAMGSTAVGTAGAWASYSSGRSRLVGGLFTPAPKYVFIGFGTNNGGALNALLYGHPTLRSIRAAAPAAQIVLVLPYGLSSSTGLPYSQAIMGQLYSQYRADFPSDNILLIQGDTSPPGLTTHYPVHDHERYAASIIRAVRDANATSVGSGTGIKQVSFGGGF
jgi:hypothetical protein